MAGIMLPLFGDLAGQGQAIAPDKIPNLNIWYNASASTTTVNGVVDQNFNVSVTNGSSIGAWNDLSGTGHDSNVFGGTGRQPTYTIPIQNGLGAVTYNPANQNNLDVNPIAWAQSQAGFTIYVVARPTSFAAKFPLTVTNANLGMLWTGTTWQVGAAAGLGTVTPVNDTTKFHIYGMVFNGAGTGNAGRLQFRLDKVNQTLNFGATTVGTTTSASATTFFFGGDQRNGTLGFMTGYIGEVLIWTRALNQSELNGTEIYLNNKWGLGL